MKPKIILAIAFCCFFFGNITAQQLQRNVAGISRPLSVYNSWAAHDEISDNIRITEELIMKELDAIIRLKKQGVQLDYYTLDANWFDKDGGFREFRKVDWPNGPDRFFKACKDNNIIPGLWLSTNISGFGEGQWMDKKPKEWENSFCGKYNQFYSLHTGGYLNHLIESMQMWYDKGVRMFKFDFAVFEAATKADLQIFTKEENTRKNEEAWIEALKKFRYKNPEVILQAYNGYGGEIAYNTTNFTKSVDLKWLDVFESLYCGDPRPSDVPCMNFWRSKDIYTCNMVDQYQFNGVPLSRIDNCGFMIGNTGTCYNRGKEAWKGTLVLSAVRGGLMNIYYGDINLLTDEDAKWFAKVQKMFFPIQEFGRIETFGNIPASREPYGFLGKTQTGALITIINPSQAVKTIDLPQLGFEGAELLFTDNGFKPQLSENKITLGSEQMAVVGVGSYASKIYDLGIQEDVKIPLTIQQVSALFSKTGRNSVASTLTYNGNADLRIVISQVDSEGIPVRVTAGSPPWGKPVSTLLNLKITQNGKEIPLEIRYDKKIWSGLSWVAVEIRNADIDKKQPIKIEYSVTDKRDCVITGNAYEVSYK